MAKKKKKKKKGRIEKESNLFVIEFDIGIASTRKQEESTCFAGIRLYIKANELPVAVFLTIGWAGVVFSHRLNAQVAHGQLTNLLPPIPSLSLSLLFSS